MPLSKSTTTRLKKRSKKARPGSPTTKRRAGMLFDEVAKRSNGRWRTPMSPSRRPDQRNQMRGYVTWGRHHKPDPTSVDVPRPLVLQDVATAATKANPLQTRRRNRARNKQARASRKLNR